MKKNHSKGFTLIEVLVVIGIIAILAAIVVIAINPARQFAQANNSQRWSNVNAVLNAVHQYAVDNRGALPVSLDAASTTAVEICKTGGTCTNLIDLSVLVPSYIVSMPFDPTTSTTNGTGYRIQVSTSSNRITVSAPGAELSQTISVQR